MNENADHGSLSFQLLQPADLHQCPARNWPSITQEHSPTCQRPAYSTATAAGVLHGARRMLGSAWKLAAYGDRTLQLCEERYVASQTLHWPRIGRQLPSIRLVQHLMNQIQQKTQFSVWYQPLGAEMFCDDMWIKMKTNRLGKVVWGPTYKDKNPQINLAGVPALTPRLPLNLQLDRLGKSLNIRKIKTWD